MDGEHENRIKWTAYPAVTTNYHMVGSTQYCTYSASQRHEEMLEFMKRVVRTEPKMELEERVPSSGRIGCVWRPVCTASNADDP